MGHECFNSSSLEHFEVFDQKEALNEKVLWGPSVLNSFWCVNTPVLCGVVFLLLMCCL